MLQILCSSVRVKKSLAHPHVARNVMLKFQKKIDQANFLSFCAHKKIEADSWRPF